MTTPTTPRSTGTRATRVIGIAAIVMSAWLTLFGLVLSPADVAQGDAVRIMYVHVPSVWLAYLAFIVTAICSVWVLVARGRVPGVDRVAGASAEIGVVFMAVTLVSGRLWGRITWGVYWQWDARLTTTALLFITYIGYLAVRGLDGSPEQRARRSAVVGVVAVAEIPLVHWSVRLWRSLHQEATVLDTDLDVDIDGLMLFTLFVGVIAFTLWFVWFVLHRARVMALATLVEERSLDQALAERAAEVPAGGQN